MKEGNPRRAGFFPRYRDDVEQSFIERHLPEGKEPTRVDKVIIFVSAKGLGEDYHKGSAYTDRQLTEIAEDRAERARRRSLAREMTVRQSLGQTIYIEP